jgi:hypothetical protein
VTARQGLLAFAAAIFVFQQVPAFTGDFGTWIDLATPFVVLGAAAWGLRGAPAAAAVVALVGAILYADGHGIHLSANDIRHHELTGEAARVAHFWDERFGHLEWHLGWLVLLAAFYVADSARVRALRADALPALLLGWALFTNTVEGGDWGLTLAAAPIFTIWAIARPGRATTTVAGATLLAAALIGVWAAWQGGVPQFSEVGWL